VILAGFLVTYGPWLIQQSDRSAVFLFYLLPTVPFMYLAIGAVVATLGRSWEARAAVVVVAALAAGSFAFFYPVMAKVPLSAEGWSDRMWYQTCDRAPPKTPGGESPPPTGWCWI
jgi:dolichyl-phosphate-mannose--protein O-mannosyl transferase